VQGEAEQKVVAGEERVVAMPREGEEEEVTCQSAFRSGWKASSEVAARGGQARPLMCGRCGRTEVWTGAGYIQI